MERTPSRGLAVVGAGRIGASLALDLMDGEEPGHVTAYVRDPASLPHSAGSHGVRYVEIGSPALAAHRPPPVRTVVFCVPDDALRDAAREWAGGLADGRLPEAQHALHTSGSHEASALAPLRAAGASIASWHPLVALAEPGRRRFVGVTFGVEGDDAAVREARRLSALLGAGAMQVRPDAKAVYHLAAVFASNHLVGCLSTAARLLERAREGDETDDDAVQTVLDALLPLARSALANVEASGLSRGVTGPIVRGDIGTIRRHLAALDPASRDLYRALGAELLRMRADDLPHTVRARLWRELMPRGGRGSEPEEAVDDE